MDNYSTETEVWKDVKGYEGIYQVSNLGRVKSLSRLITYSDGRSYQSKEKVLSSPLSSDGYPHVHFKVKDDDRTVKVHRLVAEAFVDNPNNYSEINHIDEVKHNNIFSNLEWCTRKQNMNHGTIIERILRHPNRIKTLEESKRPIIAINIETGNEIRFSSVSEADKRGFKRRNIWSAINGNDLSHKNHVWLYEKDYSIEEKRKALKRVMKKKTYQLDDDMNVVNVYENSVIASKKVGVDSSNISRAVKNKRKSAGYYWEYR